VKLTQNKLDENTHTKYKTVTQFFIPFLFQNLFDPLSVHRKLCPIPPKSIFGIDQGNPLGLAIIPSILGHTNLLNSRFFLNGGGLVSI